jgi:hypothetical protein
MTPLEEKAVLICSKLKGVCVSVEAVALTRPPSVEISEGSYAIRRRISEEDSVERVVQELLRMYGACSRLMRTEFLITVEDSNEPA